MNETAGAFGRPGGLRHSLFHYYLSYPLRPPGASKKNVPTLRGLMAFQENETVFIEDESGKRYWLKVRYGMVKVQSLGAIDGNRLKDLDDGDSFTVVGREYVVFRPGIMELMTSLDRGAQVITAKDAATILMHCDVKCGDNVLEVGAGSGGLTTALLHAVAPDGHVHTLELKEENAIRAGKNAARTGLDTYWSYSIGDARTMEPPEGPFDVLTMDMPDPWLAIDNLSPVLRSGGRVCAYVPNANQVELNLEGYSKGIYAPALPPATTSTSRSIPAGSGPPSTCWAIPAIWSSPGREISARIEPIRGHPALRTMLFQSACHNRIEKYFIQ